MPFASHLKIPNPGANDNQKALCKTFSDLGKRVFDIRQRVSGCRISLWLPVTSVHHPSISSPYKKNYFNLPTPFDLLWPFTAEAASKRCHRLKSVVTSPHLPLFLFCCHPPFLILFIHLFCSDWKCKHFFTDWLWRKRKHKSLIHTHAIFFSF